MPKTLLLADDSVTIQKVVGITFANEDIELVTVDNGDDALVRARQIKPDLVLADIGMPGLDGYALCRAIRKDPTIAHTPVLLLTGTFETYDEDKAREVGASGYISKPFEAQALVDRVTAMLAQVTAPPVARPAAPVRTLAAPAPVSAPATPQPRLELPPLPGASSAKPDRPTKPRVSSPFDFDVTPEQSVAPATATTPVAPLWEPEPELEAHDDAPLLRSALLAKTASPEEAAPATAPDATRLFAPDLLGRPARLASAPEPAPTSTPAAPAARSDFSFGDLDFEEPATSPLNQSQIFGEISGPSNSDTVLTLMPVAVKSEAPPQESPLSDPLYSKTRFLDPEFSNEAGPSFDTPFPASAPALPDLLGSEEITTPAHSLGEIELSDAEPEIEAERLDDAMAEPFSPDTSAAFEEPRFVQPSQRLTEPPRAAAATRLLLSSDAAEQLEDELDLEPDLVDAEPIPEEAPSEVPSELDSWSEIRESSEPDPRPTAPLASRARSAERPRVAAPMIDSTLLSQTLEKVAWEAFGSLSEQVVNEVRKRIESVVWEVVPQLCERLIREEIERLKADLPE